MGTSHTLLLYAAHSNKHTLQIDKVICFHPRWQDREAIHPCVGDTTEADELHNAMHNSFETIVDGGGH